MRFTFTKANNTVIFNKLSALDWGGLSHFLDGWKEGTKGYLEVKRERKPKSPQQLGYYYGKILPQATEELQSQSKKPNASTMLEIYIASTKGGTKRIQLPITKDAVDSMLKLLYADSTGEYKDKENMSMEECAKYEDWCIRWLAQHKDVFIEAANKNWKQQ